MTTKLRDDQGDATSSTADVVLEQLRNMPLLRALSDEHLRHLASIAKPQDYPEQCVIVREGEPARAIYFVSAGIVSLEISAAGVGSKRIMTVGAGELLGWSAILDPVQWTATARTLQPTSVLRFEGESLRQLCQADPLFGYELMRRIALALSKRLNATRLQLLDVFGTLMPVIEREEEDGRFE